MKSESEFFELQKKLITVDDERLSAPEWEMDNKR